MSNMSLYFAYGSNLLTTRLFARVGPCPRRGIGWLDGYSLRFHKRGRDGSGKADAFYTGHELHRLYGALFELDNPQRQQLDRFEGAGYRCDQLPVRTEAGTVHAWVYLARATHLDSTLSPYDWYLRLVEYGARETLLPDDYVASIGAVATRPDPDQNRTRQHQVLLPGGTDTSAG